MIRDQQTKLSKQTREEQDLIKISFNKYEMNFNWLITGDRKIKWFATFMSTLKTGFSFYNFNIGW